jgi:peptidoglycan/LPS O-acetylase OafA/YrhL
MLKLVLDPPRVQHAKEGFFIPMDEKRLLISPQGGVPEATGKGYIPTLDGWRAIAILPVLIAHYTPFVSLVPQRLAGIGGVGVSIFFAISGLLICTLLLQERDVTGRIDLKGFYFRRCFRILPVAWLFLFVVMIFRHVVNLAATNSELWASALFLRNYIGSTGNTTAHYWSLAIEEHFYLILPAFLAIYGSRRTRYLCLFVAVSICAWRWFNSIHPIGNQELIFYRTDLRLDALFDGALVAILLHNEKIRSIFRKAGPWIMWTIGPVGLIVARVVPSMTLSRSLEAISIPFLLVAGILFPETLLARVLEFHWLRWIGRVSYSIYIWQGLFTSNEGHLLWGERFLALNLLALLGTAVVSYYLLERPLIRWGHRIRKAANQGRSDLQ